MRLPIFESSGTTRLAPPAPLPSLSLRRSDGRQLALGASCAIGRAPCNDLVLDDAGVSARHCVIEETDSGYRIRDCGSTNGTFVGGARVREAVIAVEAQIVVGTTELRVVSASSPARAAHGIVGHSPPIERMRREIERVAPTRLAVLLLGESGTGKEVVARTLHQLSSRSSGPFVAVNCSSIAEEVAESELFGHERGAFTGAVATRIGLFQEAHGGTLFLDEIGDLPVHLQPKLLRVLETGKLRRVGGRGEITVDVRTVAATHQTLVPPRFRTDLYHRLAQFVVRLPPLRERTEDIPLLCEHFLDRLAATHGPRSLGPDLLALLVRHDWPGNVRELRNVVERAALLGGPTLQAADLMSGFERAELPEPSIDGLLAQRTLAEIERAAITAALRRTQGNRRAAAALLGLPRTTLGDRAKRYGIVP